MNNKAHLRPNDYDKNGDIIPMACKEDKGEEQMIKINIEELDREDILKAVHLLDIFTKTYCRYRNDYERFDDLKFRCKECPFEVKENGYCLCKLFKNQYAPDYKEFGCMGDL